MKYAMNYIVKESLNNFVAHKYSVSFELMLDYNIMEKSDEGFQQY